MSTGNMYAISIKVTTKLHIYIYKFAIYSFMQCFSILIIVLMVLAVAALV